MPQYQAIVGVTLLRAIAADRVLGHDVSRGRLIMPDR
jgi:hypothetical protein